jgi:uncharacterized protein
MKHALPLPQYIDPVKFAEQRQILDGFVSLKPMIRLSEAAEQAFNGKAYVHLEGDVDPVGVRFLRGTVEATLPLVCQRCLGLMEYQVKSEFLVSPVASEKEENLVPEPYDPLIVEGNELSLPAFIEEELILALPIVPLHEETDCRAQRPTKLKPKQEERQQPFKDLDQLIRGNKNGRTEK